jgi:ABC-type nickel/cobalt efflux system permease component RcnA
MNMSQELIVLVSTAAFLGFFHTLLGPDHYLPFIVMGKARQWSMARTTCITVLCGMGHVASSVLLGFIGIAMGIAVNKLVAVESFRGDLAAWALFAFGLVYFVWGMRRAWKNKPHQHIHFHADGNSHVHTHVHTEEHAHVHETENKRSITPWVLFTIFLLGPCEPLIPIIMYPAAKSNYNALILVTLIFSAVTIITMLSLVLIASYGIKFLPLKVMERYNHALAGGTIFFCGAGILFLGL